MADVPKVSRDTVKRVRAWYDENDPEAHGQTFDDEDRIRALCALAEAVLDAEEWGALCERDHHLDRYLDAIRSHLGKEERPGE